MLSNSNSPSQVRRPSADYSRSPSPTKSIPGQSFESLKRKSISRDQKIRQKFSQGGSVQQTSSSTSKISGNDMVSTPSSFRKAKTIMSILMDSSVNKTPSKASKPSKLKSSSKNPKSVTIMPFTSTIVEISRAMAGTRSDAILLVSSESSSTRRSSIPKSPDSEYPHYLVGIVTDKDLAFRCVATASSSIDPSKTPVSAIMTPTPRFIRTSDSVDAAIDEMISGHFRHLPVVDTDDESPGVEQITYNGMSSNGMVPKTLTPLKCNIVGLLDIASLLANHLLPSISHCWGTSRQLTETFEQFRAYWYDAKEAENASSDPVENWVNYVGKVVNEPNLRNVLGCEEVKDEYLNEEDYEPVLSDTGSPADDQHAKQVQIGACGFKNTALEAAQLMKRTNQTAVLVFNYEQGLSTINPSKALTNASETPSQSLIGIFTTKDIVLRILATGTLEPNHTSLIRVMTPHPDTVDVDVGVHFALGKMQKGGYLHLPVVKSEENSAGINSGIGKSVEQKKPEKVAKVIGMVDVLNITYFTMNELINQRVSLHRRLAATKASGSRTDRDDGMPKQDLAEDTNNGVIWSRFWDSGLVGENESDGGSENGIASSTVTNESQYSPSRPMIKSKSEKSSKLQSFAASKGKDSVYGSAAEINNDLQPSSTTVPALVNGTGFTIKFHNPIDGSKMDENALVSAFENRYKDPGFTSRFISKLVSDDADPSFSALAELYSNCLTKMGCLTNDDISTELEKTGSISFLPYQFSGSGSSQKFYLTLMYKDDESDWIAIQSDSDLMGAVGMARQLGWARLVIGCRVEAKNSLGGESKVLYDVSSVIISTESSSTRVKQSSGVSTLTLAISLTAAIGMGVFVGSKFMKLK